MNQPTLIDVVIGLAILGSVLSACHRGLGREMLHTVMFAIAVAIGYVLFRTQAAQAGPNDTVFWLVNSMYYIITAYVLTWALMKMLAPLIMGHESNGLRSRFWAGVLSIAKLAAVLFGLNLWFAVHSLDVHPARLNGLPPVLRNSMLVQLSDKFTDDLYRWLAERNLLVYDKTLPPEVAPTDVERTADEVVPVMGTEIPGGAEVPLPR